MAPLVPILFDELQVSFGKKNEKSINILFDSGASSSNIHKEYLKELWLKLYFWRGPRLGGTAQYWAGT